jgi:hypothetical protein
MCIKYNECEEKYIYIENKKIKNEKS